jgi:ABC-type transport system substrate-binding protein
MESARNVRKAFSYAINRQGIIDNILQGRGCHQYQYRIDACSSVWDDKWSTPYNPDRARELLTTAGYPDGFEFNFFIPTGLNSTMEEISEAIVPMWEEVGLRASIDKTAYSARRPTMLDRSISDVWMFIHGSVVSPDGVVQQWHELGGQGVWNMGAAIPGATVIANNVLHEPDWDDAWEKVAEGLDWLYEEQPVAQAVTWRDPLAVGGQISGWEIPVHPGQFPSFIENIRLNR